MKFPALLLTPFAVLLSSCSSFKVFGTGSNTPNPRVAHLVSDRPLDDYAIHSDMMTELQKRGYRVVDNKDKMPGGAVSGIIVRYMDEWKWDLSMYMQMLKITVLDGSTSNLRGTAKYETYGFHTFPNPSKVILKLFSDMDQKKVL